ncbi:cytochrome b/b6 domain-containing protein, partial [Micromonospora sp. STR1s_5]|nr:cytochrome b/b6 domain-containing protein [Micromonospora sp. STR1s_5]
MSGEAARARPAEESRAERSPAREVKAWDLPTRLFKWTLVLLVLNAWITNQRGDAGITWHMWNGYAVLVLLVFRLLWGLFGSSTARFANWVTWPWTALRYGLELIRGRGRPYLSHNPLGGWMIIALLVVVGSQAVAGLFTVDNNGIYGGPFANLDFGDPTPMQKALSRYHHQAFNWLLAFVVVHVGVNLFYQFVKKDPVIGAMITGRKARRAFCRSGRDEAGPSAVAAGGAVPR